MRPPDYPTRLVLMLGLLTAVNAEICPLETPTENPISSEGNVNSVGPIKRLMLKPKSCPDFKDDADQGHCCPSRITFGTYYCCSIEQKQEIESQIAAEKRRQFVKKYLAVIIISTIVAGIVGIMAASMICKRVRCCPLHHSKGCYSRSSNSYQVPSSHSGIGNSRYQPVGSGQARHSGTFSNLNATPPQANKVISYDAPPPYESHDDYRHIQGVSNTPASIQHRYNRIMENQLNDLIQSSGEFVIVPPPENVN